MFFFFYSQGTASVAPSPSAANITPPIGSYNPILDSDRRRNFRTKGEDETATGHSGGPKNRYGTYIFIFHLFSHHNLSQFSITRFVFSFQVMRGRNNIWNFVAVNRAIVNRLHE